MNDRFRTHYFDIGGLGEFVSLAALVAGGMFAFDSFDLGFGPDLAQMAQGGLVGFLVGTTLIILNQTGMSNPNADWNDGDSR